jgi:hypothetical protein
MMHAHLVRKRDASLQLVGADAAIGTGKAEQLQAATEELRRAALVGDDMRALVAVDRPIGGHELRQRQRVRGGAGGDGKNRWRASFAACSAAITAAQAGVTLSLVKFLLTAAAL